MICWVLSSAGRAAPLQGVGRGFEPLSTQKDLLKMLYVRKKCYTLLRRNLSMLVSDEFRARLGIQALRWSGSSVG